MDLGSGLLRCLAWAKSAIAKTMQAQFLCLAQDLIVPLEIYLRAGRGLKDTREAIRYLTRIETSLKEGKKRVACYM